MCENLPNPNEMKMHTTWNTHTRTHNARPNRLNPVTHGTPPPQPPKPNTAQIQKGTTEWVQTPLRYASYDSQSGLYFVL